MKKTPFLNGPILPCLTFRLLYPTNQMFVPSSSDIIIPPPSSSIRLYSIRDIDGIKRNAKAHVKDYIDLKSPLAELPGRQANLNESLNHHLYDTLDGVEMARVSNADVVKRFDLSYLDGEQLVKVREFLHKIKIDTARINFESVDSDYSLFKVIMKRCFKNSEDLTALVNKGLSYSGDVVGHPLFPESIQKFVSGVPFEHVNQITCLMEHAHISELLVSVSLDHRFMLTFGASTFLELYFVLKAPGNLDIFLTVAREHVYLQRPSLETEMLNYKNTVEKYKKSITGSYAGELMFGDALRKLDVGHQIPKSFSDHLVNFLKNLKKK